MAGTYRKRGNKYYLEYMYKGNRYSTTIESDDKKIKLELDKFVNEVQENEKNMAYKKLYFNGIAQEFLDNYVRKNLKPRTVDYYIYLLNSRICPYFNSYKIAEIKKSDIKNFLISISDELTQDTLKKYRNCLTTIFNYAIEMEYVKYNPASKVSLPKGKEHEKKTNFYTFEQVQKLLNLLEKEDIMHKTFIYTLIFTGMRREECLPLTFDDIDFETRLINIDKALIMSKEQGLIIDTTKSKHSIRKVSMPQVLVNQLLEYKNVCQTNRLFNLTPNSASQWFSRFVKRNNLDHISLHGLRHTYATFLISENNDINIISTLLGHANINITGQIYIEKDYTNQQKAISSFDKFN